MSTVSEASKGMPHSTVGKRTHATCLTKRGIHFSYGQEKWRLFCIGKKHECLSQLYLISDQSGNCTRPKTLLRVV